MIFEKQMNLLLSLFSHIKFYKTFFNSLFNDTKSLVAIKPDGSNPPIFFIPGAVGTVFYLYHLSHYLDREQPFYGLQARGIDGKSSPHKTVNEAAFAYISEIKLVQQHGPYFLAGHSYGSYIAFEMALQLQKQGDEVAFIGVVDSIAPLLENMVHTNTDSLETLKIFAAILSEWSGGSFEVSNMTQELQEHDIVTHLERWIKSFNPLLPVVGKDKILGMFNVLKASLNYQYKPNKYFEGNITLFKSQDSHLNRATEDDLGWSKLTTNPTHIFCLQGSHVSIMAEPNVKELAVKIQKNILGNN